MIKRKRALKQYREIKKLKGDMKLAAEGWKKKWHILISTILSARTLDETTILVSRRLYERYSSLKELGEADIKEVEKIIYSINFYKNKSKNIVSCAKMLTRDYNERVPEEYEELIKLPGVGAKTANVFLSEIGKDVIGVDTHVEYISRRLEWTKHKDPIKIGEALKKLFPKKMWKEVNPNLVRFGKKYTSRRKKNEILDLIRRIK